ncbi:MAG: sigma-70 family RNA polymerase sigma factor [Bacilli bacterium]|nr:sigma-70 family RNA polymerase sigma factor [Bacilli bacterium]
MNQENISSYEYLIKENQGLVYHVVKRFHVSSFDRDDLIQAGLMGLLEAAKKYDVYRDSSFSTYAIPYIIGSVKKEYSKQNYIITGDYYRKLIKNVQNDNDKLSYLELAKKYKTTVENVIVACNFHNNISFLKEEEVDLIKDNSTSKLDLSCLDKEELIIYQMWVNMKCSQKTIAERLNVNQSTISRKLKKIAKKVLD